MKSKKRTGNRVAVEALESRELFNGYHGGVLSSNPSATNTVFVAQPSTRGGTEFVASSNSAPTLSRDGEFTVWDQTYSPNQILLGQDFLNRSVSGSGYASVSYSGFLTVSSSASRDLLNSTQEIQGRTISVGPATKSLAPLHAVDENAMCIANRSVLSVAKLKSLGLWNS